MSPASVYSATTAESMMSPNPSDLDADIVMEITNAASPSVSDTSAMSQALSPLVVTEEQEYPGTVPELSPQDQESVRRNFFFYFLDYISFAGFSECGDQGRKN